MIQACRGRVVVSPCTGHPYPWEVARVDLGPFDSRPSRGRGATWLWSEASLKNKQKCVLNTFPAAGYVNGKSDLDQSIDLCEQSFPFGEPPEFP